MNPIELFFAARTAAWAVLGFGAVLAVVGLAGIIGPRIADRITVRRRIGRQVPISDEELMDVGYAAGVVKVGAETGSAA